MLTDEEIDALWPDITMPQKVVRREIARAVIAENNKKVLADLKPAALYVRHRNEPENTTEYFGFADSKLPENSYLYSADTVSALIQERDALAAKLQASDSAYAELDNELQQVRQQLFDRT